MERRGRIASVGIVEERPGEGLTPRGRCDGRRTRDGRHRVRSIFPLSGGSPLQSSTLDEVAGMLVLPKEAVTALDRIGVEAPARA